MSKRSETRPGTDSRDDRLRQALRANLQRRKEQARARSDAEGQDGSDKTGSRTDEDQS